MQAFPVNNIAQPEQGMTLRDYFAAKAIHIVMAGHSISNPEWKDDVAKSCYEIADAMMRERNAT